jgi:hypothetical protein
MQGMPSRCSLLARVLADAHRRHLHTMRRKASLSAFGGLHGFAISASRLETGVTGGTRHWWATTRSQTGRRSGPSLLIASCLILALRTAEVGQPGPAAVQRVTVNLDVEVEHAIHLAGRVFSALGAVIGTYLRRSGNSGLRRTAGLSGGKPL